ncbi:hypothetical protein OD350_28895 (plasmid) [Clostridium beijerinckii]|uniref:hypothetical protein n=1 Tax=Clostridium beijerinckii TaxID=1520 RepID=UPI002227DE04|nr:hypothetical protein [Clostridium beijerinckii]UYZ39093.1 hypothetical protein OD350_28895 [Clostridium beijerinckii]
MLEKKGVILRPLIPNIIDIPTIQMRTYKIKPDFTIDNSNNDSLIHSLSTMYKSPRERLSIRELKYYPQQKVYFDIIFRHRRVNFYCSIPNDYADLVVGKMKTIWNRSEVSRTEISNINSFNKNKTCLCEMVLKDFNFKSLSTAKNNLYPLTNMMGITKLLRDSEQVRINIAIEPINRQNWFDVAKDEFKSYKEGRIINNEMGTKEKIVKAGFMGAEIGLELYLEFKMLLFESIMGIVMPEKKKEKQIFEIKIDSIETIKKQNEMNGLTPNTIYKMTAESFRTKITIMSESIDLRRANMNMLSVANNYKDLNEDNELILRSLTKTEQERLFDRIINFNVMTNNKCVLSDKELAKLIQLPQKELQNEYKIESIDTREVTIPKQLQGGKVRIGIANKQGRDITATWSIDKNIMALAKLFVGCQNAGKTTAIKRTVKECFKAGYSNIVIDYIENCDTAKEIAEVIPEEDKIVLELGNKDYIPAMAYNEVSKLINEDIDPWDRIRLANLIAEQVEYLINSVTDSSTGELTAPMLRYLHAASIITFIKPGAKINDIFTILRRWDKRNEAIRYAKYSSCFEKEDDIFFDLEELHERDKEGKIIGTREHLISGILNRIIILQKNPYIKAMLTSDINENEDLEKYIEEGKSIFILIPQTKFPNQVVRDILTTFFISRLWLTVQLRNNNKDARLCNVIFDEVHQVPTTARFLSNHVTEFRRHRLGLILSCHFLKQLKDLLISLKSSGTSYILIAGTEKENLEALKQEIDPFTVEEGLKLKPYTSLNIVNYGNQYAKFITQLPKN